MIDLKSARQFVIPGLLLLGGMVNISDLAAQTSSEKKTVSASKQITSDKCVPVASWVIPGKGETTLSSVMASVKDKSVVLLGEMHANPEHHRWQLQMLATLYAARPDMVIGFEMFPRRVQKILDQWVAGKLTESEFLARSEWQSVWNTDASLYLPLFHFARMNRIPMRALNIDIALRRAVTTNGFDGVPEKDREGVTRPVPPAPEYLEFLLPIYAQHGRPTHKSAEKAQKPNTYDPDFLRFVVSQQLWDRAMAQEIHTVLSNYDKHKNPLVVGIMGSGHILKGFGVPHQLKDLGVKKIATLLPWDTNRSCKPLVEGYADAVFGLMPFTSASAAPLQQRLGVGFEFSKRTGGALVLQVEKQSIAESAGLQAGDVILEMAGSTLQESSDVIAAVKRQAPGTWLPLKVLREGVIIEIIAKFPPLVK
ncbi:Uncharacterized iron-regulated protein [Nitrosomonas eutropha]|uniref:Uncharacterized iron-regulated protein n=1 Tax=Nitrosomonas eutropha TaxID=916 RepID=A0A1I7IJ96_9PROT|nr:ChaN family lipoprotein [Nitrosomonas eutropha]SFU72992.1 Uncharacterized iron-regulated protein [Nitrosomonas eutropha]